MFVTLLEDWKDPAGTAWQAGDVVEFPEKVAARALAEKAAVKGREEPAKKKAPAKKAAAKSES